MKTLPLCLLFLALTGCATQSYTLNGDPQNEPDKEIMQTFFISGLGQTQEVDAAAVCGGADRVAKVESHLSTVDILCDIATFGIYTPRHAKVYCTK